MLFCITDKNFPAVEFSFSFVWNTDKEKTTYSINIHSILLNKVLNTTTAVTLPTCMNWILSAKRLPDKVWWQTSLLVRNMNERTGVSSTGMDPEISDVEWVWGLIRCNWSMKRQQMFRDTEKINFYTEPFKCCLLLVRKNMFSIIYI